MITQAELKELLHYDPETGLFTWRISPGRRVKAGQVAGYKNSNGYIHIRIGGKNYLAHRLVWLYVHGEFPQDQIDHIDRIRDDNRLVNLQVVTHSENHQNKSTNSSGFPGMSWYKRTSSWHVKVTLPGDTRQTHFGYYSEKSDAVAMRMFVKELHGV